MRRGLVKLVFTTTMLFLGKGACASYQKLYIAVPYWTLKSSLLRLI